MVWGYHYFRKHPYMHIYYIFEDQTIPLWKEGIQHPPADTGTVKPQSNWWVGQPSICWLQAAIYHFASIWLFCHSFEKYQANWIISPMVKTKNVWNHNLVPRRKVLSKKRQKTLQDLHFGGHHLFLRTTKCMDKMGPWDSWDFAYSP